MSTLLQEIEQFKKKSDDYIQSKAKNVYRQLEQQNNNYEEFIKKSDVAAAMMNLEKLPRFETPKSATIPIYMRFGHIIAETKGSKLLDKIPIPLLLPSADTAAVLFEMENLKPEEVPALFQTIALRYLLSLKMKVCRFYMIDADLGVSFRFFKTINNPLLKQETVCKTEAINKLMSNLQKIVMQASFLGSFPNLSAYNAQAGQMTEPYHFVFIDDFPNDFSSQALDDLESLISNNTATHAGVHIFINYNKKNNTPYDFDITRFKSICACIYSNAQGEVSLSQNWNIKIPLPKYKIVIETALPKNASQIAGFINQMKEEKETFSLDNWIVDLKKNKKIWADTTIQGIKAPVGYITPVKTFDFYLADDKNHNCKDFFALVAGNPGYGKTVLLENIIVNACMLYSPDELVLYLADFAEGVSFRKYENLPHAKSLMLANNREYALRMLRHIKAEAKNRADLYQQALKEHGKTITTLASYREITGKKLPRILLIMDEFQYLFTNFDMVSINARDELCNGVRQWRKFGISIILSTQNLSGVDFGSAGDFITYRFAFNLLAMDSERVIRNSAAESLPSYKCIMNNATDGNEQKNVQFQPAYTDFLIYVNELAMLCEKVYKEPPVKYICESGTNADIAHNLTKEKKNLLHQLEKDDFTVNNQYCDVYVGKPDLLRDWHTRIRYQKRQFSNTFIIGDDSETMLNFISVNLIQIQKQSAANSQFYIVDCFNVGDDFQGRLNGFADYLPSNFTVGDSQTIADDIRKIDEELENRKLLQTQKQSSEERIVLAILNAQNCYELKPQQPNGYLEASETAKILEKILNEGASLGIHCIIHSLNYFSMKDVGDVFGNNVKDNFDNIIFLKGADIHNIYLAGLRIEPVEENGLMIVLNRKIDNEDYEQCKSYSEITTNCSNPTINFIKNIFHD